MGVTGNGAEHVGDRAFAARECGCLRFGFRRRLGRPIHALRAKIARRSAGYACAGAGALARCGAGPVGATATASPSWMGGMGSASGTSKGARVGPPGVTVKVAVRMSGAEERASG